MSCRNIPAFDQPPDRLPAFFEAIEADTLIVGRIDADIADNLRAHGIEVVSDASGDPLTAVRSYLAA